MRSIRPILGSNKTLTWLCVVIAVLGLKLAGVGPTPTPAFASKSDLNRDDAIDLEDLKIFSESVLKKDWETVDWCEWISIDGHYQDKYDELVDFIREYFECDAPPQPPGEDPLEVKNDPAYPTRLAWGPNGDLYVSDAKVGSVFIYTLSTDPIGQAILTLNGELKNVNGIVGVAVDSTGLICVGNSRQRRVDKYNHQGELVGTAGEGTLRAPTDMTVDADNNLYVADAESDVVWVYRPDGTLLRTIRRGGLKTPMAVEITYVDDGTGNLVGELFVADKSNYLVKVFDLQGNLLRSYGGFVEKVGMWGNNWDWEGKFVGLQSLAIDHSGNLHALDVYMNKAQILDPITGDFLAAYGEAGSAPGQLKLPLDIVISATGEVIVANANNRRVEVIYAIP